MAATIDTANDKPMWLLILDRSLALFALSECVYFNLQAFGAIEKQPITSYFFVAACCWFSFRWLWQKEKPW